MIKKASELIEILLEDYESGNSFVDIDKWNKIVSLKVANYSKPYDLINKTLFIKTNHIGWKQRILLEKDRILKNLKREYPHLIINDIAVLVDEKFV